MSQATIVNVAELRRKNIGDLEEEAQKFDINSRIERDLLVFEIAAAHNGAGATICSEGILQVEGNGVGYLRSPERSLGEGPSDVFVNRDMVAQSGLQGGEEVYGTVEISERQQGPRFDLTRIEKINGHPISEKDKNRLFENLTAVDTSEMIRLELENEKNLTGRIIDLFAPIGKGQRGLIIAPVKCGKTTVITQIGKAVKKNHPEIKLFFLLVAERPNEVTKIKRMGYGEVIASTFDQKEKHQVKTAEALLDRAKRLVEQKQHVFILVDSITRLARANNGCITTGPIGRGGLYNSAMEFPRKFFGAARNTEEGGSLTIVGTTLVDTGSSMDERIFEDLMGTSDMDLFLSRELAQRQLFPAVRLDQSSTRGGERLQDPAVADLVKALRQNFPEIEEERLKKKRERETLASILKLLGKHKSNEEFVKSLPPGRLGGLFESDG